MLLLVLSVKQVQLEEGGGGPLQNLHILPMYISAVFKTHITSSELCMGPVAVEVLVLCTCEGKLNCVPSTRQRPISVQKGQAASKNC